MQQVQLEWGTAGATRAAARGDAVVVVDVLSFSTTAAIALERDAEVVLVAARPDRPEGREALSPARALALQPGNSLGLSSLNGASCAAAVAGGTTTVILGSLRNRAAVVGHLAGRFLDGSVRRVCLVACAERWPDAEGDGAMRPCLEDWLGAGAIASGLAARGLTLSSEAQAAAATFEVASAGRLAGWLRDCTSGRELIDRGFGLDVDLAARLDATDSVPVLDGPGRPLRDALDGEEEPPASA